MVSMQYKSWAWVVTVLASLSVVSSEHVEVEPEPTTGKLPAEASYQLWC